jgi:hypothetical protein
MATPITAIQRFDLSITYTEFDLLANRMGFIGLKVFPAIGVRFQNAKFNRIKVSSLLGPIEDTRRAPKGNYSRGDFEWDQDSYFTDDHGAEEPLDDRTINMYSDLLRVEQIHAMRAINRVIQAHEQGVATVCNGNAFITNSTGAATIWSTHASATPIDDIFAAITAVEGQVGMTPNSLTMPRRTLREFRQCQQVIDRVKYSGWDDPDLPDATIIAILKGLFDLENVFLANGFYNSAGEGQSPAFSRLWDPSQVIVHHSHSDDLGDLEAPLPRLGATVMWQDEAAPLPGAEDEELGLIVEEYRENATRGSVIRARTDYMIKQLHGQAGFRITGCV